MPTEVRYWFNKHTETIHKHTCPNCPMDDEGEVKTGGGWGIRENWLGPYEYERHNSNGKLRYSWAVDLDTSR